MRTGTRKTEAGSKTEWVIRVVSTGEGNNCHLVGGSKGRGPQYVADERETWDAGWYGRLGAATKTYKLRRNAERWLAERPGIQGVVEEDPRIAARAAYLARRTEVSR